MARRYSISLAESAVCDLEVIRDYYRENQVPEVGMKLVADLLASIEKLSRLPDRGRIVPEFGQPHLRELIHPPFRIVYRRESDMIRVVRIWRSERLLKLP
jgi:plasmid stabilization system protein ParE